MLSLNTIWQFKELVAVLGGGLLAALFTGICHEVRAVNAVLKARQSA